MKDFLAVYKTIPSCQKIDDKELGGSDIVSHIVTYILKAR